MQELKRIIPLRHPKMKIIVLNGLYMERKKIKALYILIYYVIYLFPGIQKTETCLVWATLKLLRPLTRQPRFEIKSAAKTKQIDYSSCMVCEMFTLIQKNKKIYILFKQKSRCYRNWKIFLSDLKD